MTDNEKRRRKAGASEAWTRSLEVELAIVPHPIVRHGSRRNSRRRRASRKKHRIGGWSEPGAKRHRIGVRICARIEGVAAAEAGICAAL